MVINLFQTDSGHWLLIGCKTLNLFKSLFLWGCSTGADLLVTRYFQESGAIFTELVSTGYSFPACRGGSAKYQTCP